MSGFLIRKIFIGISISLLFILAVSFTFFFVFFQPDNLKNQIIHQVYVQTRQNIQINGKIHWNFSPDWGLRLNDVKLKGDAVVAEKVDVVIAWQPLLSRRVVIKKVLVHNLILSANNMQINGDIFVDLMAQTVLANNLVINRGSLHATGKVTGANIFRSPDFLGQFTIPEFDSAGYRAKGIVFNFHFNNELSGNIACQRFDFNSLNFTDVHTKVTASPAKINFTELKGKIKNGLFKGKMTIDISNPIPRYMIQANFSKIKIDQLISSSLLQGLADIFVEVTMQGVTKSALLNSLNGKMQFLARDGVIDNETLLKYFKSLNQWFDLSKTLTFSQLTGSAVITNGLLSNNDLMMYAEGFTMTGKGNLELLSTKLDYRLLMQGHAKIFKQRLNFSMPFKLSGTFLKPTISPDFSEHDQPSVSIPAPKELNKFLDKTLKKLLSYNN